MDQNRGFTLLEVIAIVAAVIAFLAIGAAYFGAKAELAESKACITELVGYQSLQATCIQELAVKDYSCKQCAAYNAKLAAYNASSKCGKYGPITPITCPPPPPPVAPN